MLSFAETGLASIDFADYFCCTVAPPHGAWIETGETFGWVILAHKITKWGWLVEEYQKRIIDEKNDLDKKLYSLGVFLDGKFCAENIPGPEIKRMKRQQKIMELYSDVLMERIDSFLNNQHDWLNGDDYNAGG